MKKVIFIGIIIICVMTNFIVLTTVSKECKLEKIDINLESVSDRVVPNEFVIRFKKDIDSESKYTLIELNGGTIIGENKILDAVTVRIEGNIEVFLSKINGESSVEYIEPNYFSQFQCEPNDPKWEYQWGLKSMLCPPAWDLEKGSENVVIALIDSGVKYTHPDIAYKLWTNPDEIPNNGIDDDNNGYIDDIIGCDFVDTDEPVADGEDGKIEDNDPNDYLGHGTSCAGIIGASSNNKEGIAGIAWNSKIMALKAGYCHKDKGGILENTDIFEAIVYATDNGADIISMSFGSLDFSDILKDACQYAWDNGVILVGGVGNQNIDQIIYPAKYDSVIAVGATDYFNERCDYDRWGSNRGPEMELVAPGCDITTTVMIFNNNVYNGIDGTSASTACVAGVAALVKSKYYDKDNYWIREKLQSTAIDLGSNGRDEEYGYGKVNAFEAVGGIIPSSNEPPIPNKPTGPTTVKTKEYYYRFEIIDPNGDEVYYMVDFGEGKYPNRDRWYGLINSGEVIKIEQCWREIGKYEIRVRAMDKFGAMSEWSDPLIVDVYTNRSVTCKFLRFNFLNDFFFLKLIK